LWLVETLDPDSGGMPVATFLNNQLTGPPGVYRVVAHEGWPNGPGLIPIRVAVTAKRGSASVFSDATDQVRFETAAEVDLSDVPQTAAPGNAWDAQISVKNPADVIGVTVRKLEIAVTEPGEPAVAWSEVFAGLQSVPAGTTAPVGNKIHNDGEDETFQLNVRVTYSYGGSPWTWFSAAEQVVVVRRQVESRVTNLPASIHVGDTWTYDLELRNATALDVKHLSVYQDIVDENGNVLQTQRVVASADLELDEIVDIAITNSEPSVAGTSRVGVVLRVELDHDGRTWAYEDTVGTVYVT
jgi:hypothetical protein